MKIKEVEAATGLTRANIRFYESKGLLRPQREGNNYRDYTQEEVERLKQILLLRKLGISIEELQALFAGERPLQEAVAGAKENLERQVDQLQGALKLCQAMQKNQETMETLHADRYLPQLETLEEQGLGFFGITGDMVERYKQDVLYDLMMVYPIKGKASLGVAVALLVLGGLNLFDSILSHAPIWRCVLSVVSPLLVLLVYTACYPFYDRLSQRGKKIVLSVWLLLLVLPILVVMLYYAAHPQFT